MMSVPGLQTIVTHIFLNISQSKGNQTIKFGQLIEYNKRFVFFKNYTENKARRLVPDLFIFSNMTWKQVVRSLVSTLFDSPQLVIKKTKLYKTLDHWSRDMLNYNFSEKSLGLVSPAHFVYDFSRKLFLVLHSINWLPLLHQILGIMRIAIVNQAVTS